MTFDAILKEIKSGKHSPIYCLHGDEPYFIDKLVDYAEEHILPESARAFNQSVLYGKDVDYKYIVDEARQFPLMSDKRLIIIKEAQDMKTLKDLVDYANKPVPHAILVIAHKYKTLDKRWTLTKALDKHVLFESKKMYDNQLPTFIKNYSKEVGIDIPDQIASMLADYLGNDLNKIANEVDKLVLSNGKGAKITSEIIQDQIGISKEFNIFELSNSLAKKDRFKSLLITKYLSENQKDNPIQASTTNLFNFFLKVLITSQNANEQDASLAKKMGVSPFFVKDYRVATKNYSQEKLRNILVELRQVDIESKGIQNKSKDGGHLLTEVVNFILA